MVGIAILILLGIFALCAVVIGIGTYLTNNGINLLQAFKKHWFKVIFSLCSAVLGFIIMNNKIGGKIMGAILFFTLGWIISLFVTSLLKKISSKTLVIILQIILCLLLGAFAITREYVNYHTPTKKYYDKYGKPHYSEEERDEANFLYDLYNAVHN